MSKEESVQLCSRNVELRWVALGLLVTQTVGVLAVMRMSRIAGNAGERYYTSTAVVMSELIKVIFSFCLLTRELESIRSALYEINMKIIKNPWETFKVGIPAFLYTIQNNLLFVALGNLSAATYQITYQLKILTTALLSVIILKKAISAQQWASLLILTLGVSIIQYDPRSTGPAPVSDTLNVFIGIVSVLAACVTSGLAGVYFEMVLKESKTSIWLRNIQLGLYGTLLGLGVAFFVDGEDIQKNGFFYGYNSWVYLSIALQSAGGLIVAMVLKYADNILKCFGNTMAILFSSIISWYIGDFTPNEFFVMGGILVCLAIYFYSIPTAVQDLKSRAFEVVYGKQSIVSNELP